MFGGFCVTFGTKVKSLKCLKRQKRRHHRATLSLGWIRNESTHFLSLSFPFCLLPGKSVWWKLSKKEKKIIFRSFHPKNGNKSYKRGATFLRVHIIILAGWQATGKDCEKQTFKSKMTKCNKNSRYEFRDGIQEETESILQIVHNPKW